MPTDLDAVEASYHRCRFSEGFVETFYELFLAKSPDVSKMFRNTDFERQKAMLRESLLMMVCFNRGSAEAKHEVTRLAQRHGSRDLDVMPHLFDLWLEALCEAVARHDPEYSPALESQWKQAMQNGIDWIVSHR